MGDGFVICLVCQEDGSIQVLLQNADGAGADSADGGDDGGNMGASGGAAGSGGSSGAGQGGGGSSDDSGEDSGGEGQTVDNIDDALELVRQLYGDQMQQSGAGDDDSDSDGDAPLAPSDAKSLWNRLAARKDAQRNAN